MTAAQASIRQEPFPHSTSTDLLPRTLCNELLGWLESDAPWKLRIASFYEQWEMHLDAAALPAPFQSLLSDAVIDQLVSKMLTPLSRRPIRLMEVTAHKLVVGQTIRIHNDFVEGGESHRLLVQLNRGWRDEQGGLLMLFSSPRSDDVCRIVRPLHGSLFGFLIGPDSFHAVSTIGDGERYTLVYSFRDADAHER